MLFVLAASCIGLITCGLAQTARALPPDLQGPGLVELEVQSAAKRVKTTQPWQTGQRTLRAQLVATAQTSLSTPVIVIGEASWAEISIGSRVVTLAEPIPIEHGTGIVPLLRAKGAPRLVAEPGWLQTGLNRFRDGLDTALRGQDSAGASLVAGLTIGDESGQSVALATTMQATGLSHLTAVSGGNTAIVLILVLGLLRLRRVGVPGQVLVGLAALLGYVLLVGPQPSVLRAGAMGAVAMIGLARGGFSAGLPVLFLAAWLLLLLDPALALSLGFGLSILATAGLLALASRWQRRAASWLWLAWVPRWIILAVVVTVAAQIATAPLLLLTGNQVSLIAVPANLVVAPLVVPITILGLFATLLGVFLPALAALVATPAIWMGSWINVVADWGAGMQWAVVSWRWALAAGLCGVLVLVKAGGVQQTLPPQWTLWVRHSWRSPRVGSWSKRCVSAVADTVTSAARSRPRQSLLVAPLVFALALGVAAVAAPPSRHSEPATWRAVACDVGQGSATLLRAEATVVLVDVGPTAAGALQCLRAAEVESLTAIFLTHLHQDHVGGLSAVLAQIPTQAVYVTAAHLDPAGLTELSNAHQRPQLLQRGQQLHTGDLTADILWPPQAPTMANKNNGSLVIQFTWPDATAAITTGDIEEETQADLAADHPVAATRFATVPHHGSADMSARFPGWLDASVAVVSSGIGNEYGHPSAASLAAFEQESDVLLRTDEVGSVAINWSREQTHWWEL
ncbi:MAG: ComEC/Rec2 family competence protein [Actinomycetia bacterium]|nr:ComEC/Rec2 family competence protein [Actinomycetes bacterium]